MLSLTRNQNLERWVTSKGQDREMKAKKSMKKLLLRGLFRDMLLLKNNDNISFKTKLTHRVMRKFLKSNNFNPVNFEKQKQA